MDHSLELHKQKLDELCRLCGNRVLTKFEKNANRKKLLCADFTDDIVMVFNIFTQKDNAKIHPKYFCYKCRKMMMNFKKRGSHQTLANAQVQASWADKMWTGCDTIIAENECAVCVQFFKTSLGNRQIKQTKKDLFLSPSSTENQQKHIVQIDSSSTGDRPLSKLNRLSVYHELQGTNHQDNSMLKSQTPVDARQETCIPTQAKSNNFGLGLLGKRKQSRERLHSIVVKIQKRALEVNKN